jgi:nitrate/TMAO reductase-like tetraheme cytochrome c subunit
MSLRERIRDWSHPVFFLSQNALTVLGTVITTSTALTTIAFWFYEVFLPGPPHPYIGILFFLIFPGIFVLGLLLIALGIWVRRRSLKSAGTLPESYPLIDLHLPVVQRTVGFVALATVLNLLIVGTAAYRGVEYMDTTNFCGATCHTVMQPEYTAYQNSPHSRVECVECHIGPGATWFVRSKVSGLKQVYAIAFHTYPRPIPSPVKDLRPARATCEHCHWPQRFTGDKFVVKTNYASDEKNTPQTTTLLVKVGGRTWRGSVGIHGRHLDDGSRVQYIASDEQRQVIPIVYYTDNKGKAIEFLSTDSKVSKEQLEKKEKREMDCIDCHNRPTHTFEMPDNAVDEQMSVGHISPALPFIKKKAIELLKADYATRDAAKRGIIGGITSFYQTSYPAIYQSQRAVVEQSGEEITAIYLRNIFPEMRVTWGTHPNNIGHTDSPGCFRCHDGSHTSADGQTITNDCSACHQLLSADEDNSKILKELGMK